LTKVQLRYLRVAVMIPRINVWHFVSMDMLLLQDMLFWQPQLCPHHHFCSKRYMKWESICAGLLLFVYICIVSRDPLSEGEGWNHINWFNAAASTSSQELDFQCHILWSFFMFNDSRWEMIVLVISVELLTIFVKTFFA
jgi:hypothetical protein